MKSISKITIIYFIACVTFTTLYSCKDVAKQGVKTVLKTGTKKTVITSAKKTAKTSAKNTAKTTTKKGTKEVLEKSKKAIGRPLPKGGTVLSDKARKEFQRRTGLSKNACKDIRTVEQAEVFEKLKLRDYDVPARTIKDINVPGRNVKFPKDLPLQTKMKDIPGAKELVEKNKGNWDELKDWTNLDLMGDGRNPIFPADKKRGLKTNWGEVHHDNQTHASNYTILRKEHHTGKGYNDILHDNAKSEIDHDHFKTYEAPAMLEGLTKVLESKYGGWTNIPDKILF